MPEKNSKNEPQKESAESREAKREFAALLKLGSGLGISVCAGICVFFFAGKAIDDYLHTNGIAVAVAILTGIAASFAWAYYCIMRHLSRFSRSSSTKEPNQSDG